MIQVRASLGASCRNCRGSARARGALGKRTLRMTRQCGSAQFVAHLRRNDGALGVFGLQKQRRGEVRSVQRRRDNSNGQSEKKHSVRPEISMPTAPHSRIG